MIFKSWRAWAAFVVGVAISAVFLWLALREVNGQELLAAFRTANYPFVVISAAAMVGGLILRATRWRLIASSPPELQASYMRAANIGALSNMILPARAGEFIRIFTLARLTGRRLINVIVSSVLDRLVDIAMLLICTAGLYMFMPRGAAVDNWLGTIVIVSGSLIAGVVVVGMTMGKLHTWLNWFTENLLKRWQLRPSMFLAELQTEARNLLGGWMSIKLLSVILLIVILDFIAIGGQLLAFHLQLPVFATILLWVFLSIGSMLPSAPGYIGVYQTAAVWALSVFSVPPTLAVAVAIVFQAAALLVTVVMTGPSFLRLLKSALTARSKEAK